MGFIYSLRPRAYFLTGTVEEKLRELQRYSKTDYLIAKVFLIPEKFHIDSEPIYHKEALDLIDSPIALFEEAI